MEKNYKYSLQERLNYYVECKNNWLEYFKHEEVNERAEKRLFGNNIIFCLIMELYFLPINLLKYYQKKRAQHIYNKLLIIIQVLKEELGTINNNQTWRKND